MDRRLNLHLQQLAYLREVADGPTVRAAAKRLRVSQPALSQGLKELERRLDVTLFEKVGRRLRLTADGKEVALFADTILAQAAELGRRLEARARGEEGSLRIGMIDAANLYLMPAALRAFRTAHPAVELKLTVATSDALLADLRRFALDLAVVVGPLEALDLEVELLFREPLFVYAPAGSPRVPKRAEWASYAPQSHTRAVIDEALGNLGIRPHVTLESHNPQVLRQMVALGIGWAVLPAGVAETAPAPLKRWRKKAVVTREIYAARRLGAPRDPRASKLLSLARRRH